MIGVAIVNSTACASSIGSASSGGKKELAKKIEEAMVFAIKKAQEEGVVDPDIIRDRMLLARAAVKEHPR